MFWFRGKWEAELEYILIGHEKHKDEGDHLHVMLLFMNTQEVRTKSFDILKEGDTFHPNIQTARSARNVIDYCKKGGDWMDWGVSPLLSRQMTRNEKINYILTHDIDEILKCGMFGVGEMNGALRLKREMEGRRLLWPTYQKRKVFWFYGSTGSGKTRVGMRIVRQEERWVKMNGSMRTFMNGYTGQTGVLIDDLRAGSIDFETLLSILDGYPTFVNVKGGYLEWSAKVIVITAPKRPEEIFFNHEQNQPWDKVDQLLRRIDVLRDFDEKKYGDDPDDMTTVVMPMCGPLVRSLPTEEMPACEPPEAEIEEEVELSAIPGSLNGSIVIVDGSVVPKN